jgi:hypothetical protein
LQRIVIGRELRVSKWSSLAFLDVLIIERAFQHDDILRLLSIGRDQGLFELVISFHRGRLDYPLSLLAYTGLAKKH